MSFFDKTPSELTPTDIKWLIDEAVQEGQDIDFKRTLSTSDGAPDRWISHGDRIGDQAKRAVVKELVGFANADGGSLVLGIDESDEKPPTAKALTPLPNVVELADRLKRSCRDLIDPMLHTIEAAGISTQEDGSGVVVLRIPNASPAGPHRSRPDRECYLRRHDETTPMTMDEIRRHVMDFNRRLDRIDAEFDLARKFEITIPAPAFAMRIMAVPLARISVPNISRVKPARVVVTPIPVQFPDSKLLHASTFHIGDDWRPIVRGTKCSTKYSEHGSSSIILRDDGRISLDWQWSDHPKDPSRPLTIPIELFISFFGNALLAIERLRRAAKVPSAEYAMEYTISTKGGSYQLLPYGSNGSWRTIGEIDEGHHCFGRYPVGSVDEFSSLTSIFETDVFNLAGRDFPKSQPVFDYGTLVTGIKDEFEKVR